ncbi:hypothetical protein DFH28DRAFT_922022 [Melampsora americana]|nr:hypothetical protein DFH28DRAFT_922022 [Melampsora americana]
MSSTGGVSSQNEVKGLSNIADNLPVTFTRWVDEQFWDNSQHEWLQGLQQLGCPKAISMPLWKEICASTFDQYVLGMYHMVLNSEVAPNVSWKVPVGQTTPSFALGDHLNYFNFVNHVNKSQGSRATLWIHTKCSKVAARKKAQESSAEKLNASTDGSMEVKLELAQAKEHLKTLKAIAGLRREQDYTDLRARTVMKSATGQI